MAGSVIPSGVRLFGVITVLVALGPRASASPLDVVGLTSRHAAQANAGVASVDDAAALYYDPAGLVAAPALELSIGTVGAHAFLDHAGALPDPLATQIAARAPLPLGGPWAGRIVVGVALHLLPSTIARITAPAPDAIVYPYYGDRLSRIVILPGAAVRFGDLAMGAAVDILAGLDGTLSATEGATRAIDARIDERVPTVARLIAGATWQLSPELRIGAVYRERFEIPFATNAATMVAGEPIELDLRASANYSPHQVVAGVAWSREPLTASLDVGWAHWSGFAGPYVQVDSQLPLVGPVPGQPPHVPFRDTIAVRLGVESRGDLILRGGYAFETSAVPNDQKGVTNLLDGFHHLLAAGAGYRFGRVRIDAHVQLQIVQPRTITKALFDGTGTYDPFKSLRDEDTDTPGMQTTNPGFPSVHGGGAVLAGGLTLEVGL